LFWPEYIFQGLIETKSHAFWKIDVAHHFPPGQPLDRDTCQALPMAGSAPLMHIGLRLSSAAALDADSVLVNRSNDPMIAMRTNFMFLDLSVVSNGIEIFQCIPALRRAKCQEVPTRDSCTAINRFGSRGLAASGKPACHRPDHAFGIGGWVARRVCAQRRERTHIM
jgi:hypothetical protein